MNSLPPVAQSSGKRTAWLVLLLVSLLELHLTTTARATTHISIAYNGANVTLSWNSSPGTTYEVQSRGSLATGSWTSNETAIAEGNTAYWADPDPLVSTRFYRLLLPNGEQSLYEMPPEMPPAAPVSLDFFPPGTVPFDGVATRVHGFSGEFELSCFDLHIPGRGPDFIWARKYRSRVGPDTAQGNGWDYSYNIFARRVGSHVEVHDGNSRRDIYLLQTNGTFALDGFFREGSISNNAFTLMFADTGTWEFHPFDHATAPGKIRRSTDRNSNAMEFQYDGLSRLVRVVDGLNRTNTVSYDVNGFISAVTDFSGRQVRYEYYSNLDPDGSLGDLKLVISPVVTNTPNGNDFPGGKTNRYTYSKGLTPDALNHNLLTEMNALGQVWRSNRYHTATSPTNLNYDRIEIPIEIVPLSLQSIHPVYVPITPDPTNNNATKKTIVNDAVGNVREYYYDALNRLVMKREFTGRATPGTPTTESSNRPVAPLRLDDPAFFETQIDWNADSLPVLITFPASNSVELVHEGDVYPFTAPRYRGNLREYIEFPGLLGGDQPAITNKFEFFSGFGTENGRVPVLGDSSESPTDMGIYPPKTGGAAGRGAAGVELPPFGGWSGPSIPLPPADFSVDTFAIDGSFDGNAANTMRSFVTQHTDARGNVATRAHDLRGNCTNVIHRLPGTTEKFEYNAYGQLTAHVLPENSTGHNRRDEFTYYASGPQMGYLQNAIVDATVTALTTTYEYDSLGRVVRHIDPRGNDTLYTVNGLGQVVRTSSREVTIGSGIRYQRDYFYDANNNVVRVDVQNRDETGALGANSDFTTAYEYDSLNRRVRSTREVDVGLTITNEFIYDANDHLTVMRSGLAVSGADTNNVAQYLYDERDLPFQTIRGPGGTNQSSVQYDYDANGNRRRTQEGLESTPRVTDYVYDGFDRLVRQTNGMGSLSTWHYDPNGNVVSIRFDGETNDVAGAAGNLRLCETFWIYDKMDRCTNRIDGFFDTYTQVPLVGGFRIGLFDYAPNGQVKRTTDDNTNIAIYVYDSANRLQSCTDPKTNSVTYEYDANGNVTNHLELEQSDVGYPPVPVTNIYAYDGLDRKIRKVDNAGITNQSAYDSRNNSVVETDGRGISTRYEYDGLNRRIRSIRDMNNTGPNAAEPADIVFTYGYDDSSRRISVTDDNTNTTRYAYDALDHRIRTILADDTTNRFAYDVRDNLIQQTDAQGTVVTNGYDLLDRRTVRRVTTLGAGVIGPTLEFYQYDGLSRLVQANSSVAFTSRQYDSLGNLVSESQQVSGGPLRTTSSQFDGVGNRTQVVYPGGRTLVYAYDSLNRITQVHDNPPGPGTLIASRFYVGANRVQRVDYANSNRLDVFYDPARRTAGTAHSNLTTSAAIDVRAYQWDNGDNKVLVQSSLGLHNMGYDPANRLAVSAPPLAPPTTYQLDGNGNRQFVNGPSDAGPYQMNPTTPEPADFQVNQYSQTPFDNRSYNRNGNLTNTSAGPRNYAYDSRDQLTTFLAPGLNALHKYDCLGRRIEKNVNGQITRFYYDGGRVIEEQDAANNTVATYCYLPADIRPGDTISGVSVDNDDSEVVFCSLVQMRRGVGNYYFHTDDLGSVMKVTDQTGAIVEQYQYGDYGAPSFFDGTGAPIGGGSAIGNPYLFHAMRIEPESQLYFSSSAYARDLPDAVYGPLTLPSWQGPLPDVWFGNYFDPRAGCGLSSDPGETGNNPASGPLLIDPPIPAGFSGPGSRPLSGIALPERETGTDTLVRRFGDPFDRPPAVGLEFTDPVLGGTIPQLDFQTDGPIICQALFQCLVPRPPLPPPPLFDPPIFVFPPLQPPLLPQIILPPFDPLFGLGSPFPLPPPPSPPPPFVIPLPVPGIEPIMQAVVIDLPTPRAAGRGRFR